jgi:hypothetical protein
LLACEFYEEAAHASEKSEAFPYDGSMLTCEYNEEAAHASEQSEPTPNKSSE